MLDDLADALNSRDVEPEPAQPFPKLLRAIQGPSRDEWLDAATDLLESASRIAPAALVVRFNALARETPVILALNEHTDDADDAGRIVPLYTATRPRSGSLLPLLWHALGGSNYRVRLKRCPSCRLWFVDRTRGNRKRRCTSRCTERIKKRRARARARSVD
jgi:predicted RNA-binding Zn ribbon-like protein